MTCFEVQYAVRTGINGSVVATSTLRVAAPDRAGAEDAAVAAAYDSDPYVDPRIDPSVQILSVTAAEDGDDDDAAVLEQVVVG